MRKSIKTTKRYICKTLALLLLVQMFFGVFAKDSDCNAAYAEDYAIGSYITFGTYPQTAEGSDDTPIEWLVLDRDGDKALLLSRYGLDAQPYNEDLEGITWEKCTLRTWLNDDFIKRAFTLKEQSAIMLTNVDNSENQRFADWNFADGDITGGNNTQDKIFLLSYAEANEYLGVTGFDSNIQSRIAPTTYAIAQNAYVDNEYLTAESEDAVYWWLRSPGPNQNRVSNVSSEGCIGSNDANFDRICVRPALWVDVSLISSADAEARATSDKSKFTVGNYVSFGTYPQTASGNDETPIEWLVLDRDGDKALLLSRYALDAQPYNESYTDITWEKCTLRTWLNGSFMKRAFTDKEQAAILLTNVDNSDGQGFDFTTVSGYAVMVYAEKVTGGNDTQDKIFLLSYAEANKYLGVTYGDYDNTQSRVAPTAYVIAQNAYVDNEYLTAENEDAAYWWLRSPGLRQYSASGVDSDGSLSSHIVDSDYYCVRPALWVDVSLISSADAEAMGTFDITPTATPKPTATPTPKPTSTPKVRVTSDKSKFAVGNYVSFGTYPQTASGNDETPIEWLVLERSGNYALLLSRYALDAQPYNESYTDITWEKCTLRTWLNDDFINRAFTAEEQSAIRLTNVDNSDSQGFDFTTVIEEYAEKVTGGNNTQDKIFLLSYAEANKYLEVTCYDSNNIRSRVAPTAYALAQGAWTSDSNKTADGEAAAYWWLRSPGYYQDCASNVYCDGSLDYSSVNYVDFCVRPALWVDVSLISSADAEAMGTFDITPTATPEARATSDKSKFTVGNYVSFGTYPQTASGNDETPIEWLVLDRDGDKALLLSRYGLDAQPYNESYTDITWENCTVRTWLNDDFINRAFTAEEQSAIRLTNVDNSDSQGFDFTTVIGEYAKKVTGGNNTQDKIFLLSYAEANKYLEVTCYDSNNIQSSVAPTAYAKAQGAYTNDDYKTADGEAAGWWWLRSPGRSQDHASGVGSDGFLNYCSVYIDNCCIRPALWVNLESGIF